MATVIETLIARHNEIREELTALVEVTRARVLEGGEGRGMTADERSRSEEMRGTLHELREQIEAERELLATEEAERGGLSDPSIHSAARAQNAEDMREMEAGLRSILRGTGSEGPAQNWRSGPTTWNIPMDLAVRSFLHLLDQRVATGQAAVPTPTLMSSDSISMYVRAMRVMGEFGVMPDAGTPAGDALYAWVTSEQPASNTAEDTSLPQIPANATTFDRQELSAIRTRADRSWTGESRYAFESAEQTLMLELTASLTAQWEAQAVNGNGTSPNFTGLFSAAAQHGSTNAAVDTAATISAAIHSMVDGVYCSSSRDIRLLMGSATYAWLASIPYIAIGNRSETSLIEWIESRVGLVRVTGYAPAVDTSTDERLHSVIAKRGSQANSYCWPMWNAMELKVDDTSDAGTRVVAQSYSNLLFAGATQGRADWQELILREATA